jgi:type IV pilus assembly protein PilW
MMHNNLKRYAMKQSGSKQNGMSLIEVMVAMTIGLIILIALGYFFLGSININRTTDDISRMQESGRNALEIMGRSIRQAGYRRDVKQGFGGDVKGTPNYEAQMITGVDGAGNAPDSITVKYDAQPGGDVDCTGADVAAGTELKPNMVTATFAITDGALTCNNGTSTVTVVDNIENMQISYVIDTSKVKFKKNDSADKVTTKPTKDEFRQVGAVQVTLLTRGPTPNVAVNNSQTLTYNSTAPTIYADGFLRQVYSATYNVRNQSWRLN